MARLAELRTGVDDLALVHTSTVRTVCAYSLWFAGEVADELWKELGAWIGDWYQASQPPVALPAGWLRGLPELAIPSEGHALECTVTALDGRCLREMRWRFPDGDDESLLWTVEAAVLHDEGTTFTLLLRIASVDFEVLPARIQLRTPRVIKAIVARGDAHVGVHPVDLDPIELEPDGIPPLCDLLSEQSRRHPIIVVSPAAYTDDVYAVDATAIASTLAGLVSVYVLTSRWAAFALTDELGKQYSCYNGATRIYWPRFEVGCDPFTHPLWLPAQIEEFGGTDGFARYLLRMIAGAGSFRYVEPEPIRTFKARLDEVRIARLRAEGSRPDYDGLFDEYVRIDALNRELRTQLDAAIEDNASLRATLASRWVPATQDRVAPRLVAQDERSAPRSMLEAVEGVQRRATNLIFLTDALESAAASPYRQPDRAVSALLAIDDVARSWAEQLAGGQKLGARRDAFRKRGFEYKEDISQTAEGKWGDEYTYEYDGRRIVFAPHITIGAKSPDRCLSIHMHWDEIRRKVVIAHVGRHKTNTRS